MRRDQVKPLHREREIEIHICYIPWRKYHLIQKLILPAVLKKTAHAERISEGDRTNFLSLYICMSNDQEKQKQNSPGNLRQKQQNEVKSILNFLLDCWFCEICEGVSVESMIQ
jgi:hypothetical protein